MNKPLAIDLFCGLGGWTDGLLAEGYDVIGFDIERHEYDGEKYPAQLVLQNVLDIDGKQFRDAQIIVASPPCQEYSYMAMPWTKAKEIRRQYLAGEHDRAELTALFDACFRIQREAIEAAGQFIPLVVENVRGAQEWVGRSRWNFGSFHLWGDVPALMPVCTKRGLKGSVGKINGSGKFREQSSWDRGSALVPMGPGDRESTGLKSRGMDWSNPGKRGQDFTHVAGRVAEGRKGAGAGAEWFDKNLCKLSSKSASRKAASARIAKIPFVLSQHIARTYKPLAAGCAA